MRTVLRSIKPYWFYLICEGKKTIEVGKNAPTAEDWDRITYLYCSNDMNSFNRIPKEHREQYRKYLGKVGAKFVCDKVYFLRYQVAFQDYDFTEIYKDNNIAEYFSLQKICLTQSEICEYGKGKNLYGWHISEMKIYSEPMELSGFAIRKLVYNGLCGKIYKSVQIQRPPQSWYYVDC